MDAGLARFLADMHAGDWIQAVLLAIAAAGLFWTASALREQARSRDFENYLILWEKFATAWQRFGAADENKRFFEFTELMNLLEAACCFYNRNVIRGVTKEMVGEYLKEVLPAIFEDAYAKATIPSSFSGPSTFFEIRQFARKHGLKGVPQR